MTQLSFQVGTCDRTSKTKINNMMHQETPYKTIQRTKYIVQVAMRVPPQARLTNNPDMIDKLVDCCNERLSLGKSSVTVSVSDYEVHLLILRDFVHTLVKRQ